MATFRAIWAKRTPNTCGKPAKSHAACFIVVLSQAKIHNMTRQVQWTNKSIEHKINSLCCCPYLSGSQAVNDSLTAEIHNVNYLTMDTGHATKQSCFDTCDDCVPTQLLDAAWRLLSCCELFMLPSNIHNVQYLVVVTIHYNPIRK